MTPATFVQHFPEFADISANYVAAKLVEASTLLGGPDPEVWGCLAPAGKPPTQADLAQAYRAADLLIRSPLGAATLMASDNPANPSSYMLQFRELQTSLCFGPLVAGGRRAFC